MGRDVQSWGEMYSHGAVSCTVGLCLSQVLASAVLCSPYPLSCSILVAKLQLYVPAVATTSMFAALNLMTLLVDEWEPKWHPLST